MGGVFRLSTMTQVFLFFVFLNRTVIEPRASGVLGRRCTTELHGKECEKEGLI